MTVAIVTGSDSGIGRATAVALAEDGFDVGVTWHSDEEGAEGTAREVSKRGRRAQTRRLDLTALPEAADQIDDLCEALGGIELGPRARPAARVGRVVRGQGRPRHADQGDGARARRAQDHVNSVAPGEIVRR